MVYENTIRAISKTPCENCGIKFRLYNYIVCKTVDNGIRIQRMMIFPKAHNCNIIFRENGIFIFIPRYCTPTGWTRAYFSLSVVDSISTPPGEADNGSGFMNGRRYMGTTFLTHDYIFNPRKVCKKIGKRRILVFGYIYSNSFSLSAEMLFTLFRIFWNTNGDEFKFCIVVLDSSLTFDRNMSFSFFLFNFCRKWTSQGIEWDMIFLIRV